MPIDLDRNEPGISLETEILTGALEGIIANAPAERPEPESYIGTKSAYLNGLAVARWEAAEIARSALLAWVGRAPETSGDDQR